MDDFWLNLFGYIYFGGYFLIFAALYIFIAFMILFAPLCIFFILMSLFRFTLLLIHGRR